MVERSVWLLVDLMRAAMNLRYTFGKVRGPIYIICLEGATMLEYGGKGEFLSAEVAAFSLLRIPQCRHLRLLQQIAHTGDHENRKHHAHLSRMSREVRFVGN